MWKWDRRLLTLAFIFNFAFISSLEAWSTFDDDDDSAESSCSTPTPTETLKLKSNPFEFKKSSNSSPKKSAKKTVQKKAKKAVPLFEDDDDADLSDFVVADDVVDYVDEDANNASGSQDSSSESSSTTELLEEEAFSDDEPAAPAIIKSSEKPKSKLVPKKNSAKSAQSSSSKKQAPVIGKKRSADQRDDEDLAVVVTKSKSTETPKAAANSNHQGAAATSSILKVKELTEGEAVPKPFRNKSIAFVDSETTSFSAEIGGRLVSFGGVIIKDGVETKRKEWIFNPGKDSNKGAFLAHKISRSVTEKKPPFEALSGEISDFLEEADIFVAHNAAFDYRYLRAEHERAGILKQLQRWKLSALLDPRAPLHAKSREFLAQQLAWVKEDEHIKAKRLGMLQSRLTTAIWLYSAHQKVLEKGELLDPETGRFAFPFLPTPKNQGVKNVPGFAKNANNALLSIYRKLETLEGRTQSEREYIGWKKFDRVDISDLPEFSDIEKRRKARFDRQIRAAALMKKFEFAALEWSAVYDWGRVANRTTVFYTKPDQAIMGEIIGYLNLAKDLVDNEVCKADANPPKFLDFDNRWIDTLKIAKGTKDTQGILRKGKDVKGFKLNDLCQYYGVSLESRENSHGALIDSDLLARVFAHLYGTELVDVPKEPDQKKAKTEGKKKTVKFAKSANAMAEDEIVQNEGDGQDDDELIGGLF